MPDNNKLLIPNVIPRAYTIQEMEEMRGAIRSIMIGHDYTDNEYSRRADRVNDKIVIEERLRTHMLCNQDPLPLIIEGKRLSDWRKEKHDQARARWKEKWLEEQRAIKAKDDAERAHEIRRQELAFQESEWRANVESNAKRIREEQASDPKTWILCMGAIAIGITFLILM